MNPTLIKLILAATVAAVLGSQRASANPIAYEATGGGQFGTIDLSTGVFSAVGTMGTTLAGIGDYGGVIFGGADLGTELYSVNTSNGALTPVGNSGITYSAFGSTTSGLYALDRDNRRSNAHRSDRSAGPLLHYRNVGWFRCAVLHQ